MIIKKAKGDEKQICFYPMGWCGDNENHFLVFGAERTSTAHSKTVLRIFLYTTKPAPSDSLASYTIDVNWLLSITNEQKSMDIHEENAWSLVRGVLTWEPVHSEENLFFNEEGGGFF